VPGSSAGTVNAPLAEDTASKLTPVATFFTATVAPGMTPPPVSVMTPERDVVPLPCANTTPACAIDTTEASASTHWRQVRPCISTPPTQDDVLRPGVTVDVRDEQVNRLYDAAMALIAAAWLLVAQLVPAPVSTIDFVVTTADGNPVTDLTAAELTLRIDGKTRLIRALHVVNVGEAAELAASAPPAPYGTNGLTNDGRSLVLAIDQESFRAGREQPLRDAIDGLLAALGPRDRVLFVTLPLGGVKVPFTTDHARVSRAAHAMTGQRPQNETGSDVACRTRRVLETVAGFLDVLKYADSPTSVVFFTGGMVGPRRDAIATMSPGMCELTVEHFNRVGRAAGLARANFYVTHPDDISTSLAPARDSLATFAGSDNPMEGIEHLAGVTGGRRLPLSASGDAALKRIAKETAAYYIAEIDAEPADRDGRSRQVTVRVARRGAQVQFRPTTTFPVLPRPRLTLRTSAYATRGPGGKIRVMALVEPEDPATVLSRVTATLVAGDGSIAAHWNAADPAQVPLTGTLLVAPGTYRLRVIAESRSGSAGTVDYPVAAELTAAGPLEVGSLMLGVSRDGIVVPKLEFGPEPVALGTIEFHGQPAGGRLTVGLEIARTVDGPAMNSTPLAIARVGDDDYSATGAVPIAALPPGDYVVRAVIGLEGQPTMRVVRTLRKVKQ
jgi:VWFA-related protein